jgi:hypothetical protein
VSSGTPHRPDFRGAISHFINAIVQWPLLRVFRFGTHFVSTVHHIFFPFDAAAASVISAIRIVEQAIRPPPYALPYRPKNGALVLFGFPNVINQALATCHFQRKQLCSIGMGYAFPALDFPLPHRNSCRLFAGPSALSLARGVLT